MDVTFLFEHLQADFTDQCDVLAGAQLLASWATMLFRAKTEEERIEGKKAMLAALETLEGALAKCSGGKDFFGGDSVEIGRASCRERVFRAV